MSYRPLVKALGLSITTLLGALSAYRVYETVVEGQHSFSIWMFVLGFAVLYVLVYALLLRRGRHNWNVSSLAVTVEYLSEDGSKVEVRRTQIMSPNRADVHSARIRLSSGPERGRVETGRWPVQQTPGSVLGQQAAAVCIEKSRFREDRGTWLYIHTSNSKPFPYPGYIALLHPKWFPQKFFSLTLKGASLYRNSFTENEEYLQTRVESLVDSVKFKLILPVAWSKEPKVNLYRMREAGLEKVPMEGLKGGSEGKMEFGTEIRGSSNETLRLDWRRPPKEETGPHANSAPN